MGDYPHLLVEQPHLPDIVAPLPIMGPPAASTIRALPLLLGHQQTLPSRNETPSAQNQRASSQMPNKPSQSLSFPAELLVKVCRVFVIVLLPLSTLLTTHNGCTEQF